MTDSPNGRARGNAQIEKPASVRIATVADIEAIYWTMFRLWQHNYMGLGISPQKILSISQMLCSGVGGIVGIIDGPDGHPTGAIGVGSVQPAYSSDWILSEFFTYVEPSARKGSRLGRDLLDFALWYQKHIEAKIQQRMPMEMSIYTLDRIEAKTRLLKRYGKHVGSMVWVGEIPSGQGD